MENPIIKFGEILIVIRRINSKDYYSLCEFFQINRSTDVRRQFNPFPLSNETAKSIAFYLNKDHFFGAFIENKIIGFLMLRGWEEGYSVPSLGVLVEQEYRGIGVGKLLTHFGINMAKKLDCSRLRLSVYASNIVAIGLYKSFGFVEQERIPVFIMGENDEKVVMIKEI